MTEFDRLVDIVKRLRAPDGCPWDRKQTLYSLKDALLELRINKYIKYDSETKKLIAAPIPYTEWDEDLR